MRRLLLALLLLPVAAHASSYAPFRAPGGIDPATQLGGTTIGAVAAQASAAASHFDASGNMTAPVASPSVVMGGTTGSVVRLPTQNCQPVGQSTAIYSLTCMRTLSSGGSIPGALQDSEEYAYSFSYRVIPTAADLAAYNFAQSNNVGYYSDKVGMYLGVEGLPSTVTTGTGAQIPQDVWGENWTVLAGGGTVGGYAGLELDMNNYQSDSMGGRSSFGLWLTGGGPYRWKDAIFITGANSPYAYQWHNGLHCAYEISDSCVEADSPSSSLPMFNGFSATGSFAYGINLLGIKSAAGAQIALSSAAPTQIAFAGGAASDFWDSTNGLCRRYGGSSGPGVCLTSAGTTIQGSVSGSYATFSTQVATGNLSVSQGVFLPLNGANQPLLTTDPDGLMHIQAVKGGTGLRVDGPITTPSGSLTANSAGVGTLSVTGAMYLPKNSGNQTVVGTDPDGSVHLKANQGGTALIVDGPITTSGTITTANLIATGVVGASNISATGGLYLPTNAGNQPLLTTNSDGSVHIQANKGSTGLTVDGTITALMLVSDPVGAGPAHNTSPCTPGQTAWNAVYEYRCVATNSWQRWARNPSDTW